jgi:hypothetical protein
MNPKRWLQWAKRSDPDWSPHDVWIPLAVVVAALAVWWVMHPG